MQTPTTFLTAYECAIRVWPHCQPKSCEKDRLSFGDGVFLSSKCHHGDTETMPGRLFNRLQLRLD